MHLHVGRQLLDHVTYERKFGTNVRDLIEEASRWDLEPKPACLWWTSMYDSVEKSDMIWAHRRDAANFPGKTSSRFLGCALNRQRKKYDAVEERMQSASKAFWKDILINKKQICSVELCIFCVWSENWSWTIHTDDGKDHRMGNQDNDAIIPSQKTKRRNVGRM